LEGWKSERFSRTLSVLYLLAGIMSLLVFLLPIIEATAIAFGVVMSIWQGVFLLKTNPQDLESSNIKPIQPD